MSRLLADVPLLPHPGQAAPNIAITVAVGRLGAGQLALRYRLSGRLDWLVLPKPSFPIRVDGLWEATCFEAFVQAGDGPAYQEHNFAPSGAWAAYLLDGHRTGWRWSSDASDPGIHIERLGDEVLDLHATIEVPPGSPLRLGLTAVIKASDGALSYWALAHPPEKPDFHDAACFTFHVPAWDAG